MPPPTSDPSNTPDPRLWYIDPARLRRRDDRPIRFGLPALEIATIQLGQLTSPIGRPLDRLQIEMIQNIYGDSVDASRVRIAEARIANAPTTLGNQIRIAPGFSFLDEEGKSTLIHEMGHIWQYQTRGTRYITESVVCQIGAARATGTRNAAYFNYQLNATSSIGDFPAEEQATIIEDYYGLTVRYAGATMVPPWVVRRLPELPIYERLIAQVRGARPRSETVIYEQQLMVDPAVRYGLPPNDHSIAPTMPIFRLEFGR